MILSHTDQWIEQWYNYQSNYTRRRLKAHAWKMTSCNGDGECLKLPGCPFLLKEVSPYSRNYGVPQMRLSPTAHASWLGTKAWRIRISSCFVVLQLRHTFCSPVCQCLHPVNSFAHNYTVSVCLSVGLTTMCSLSLCLCPGRRSDKNGEAPG